MVKEKETEKVLLDIHDAGEAVDRTERAKPYYNYLNDIFLCTTFLII